MLIRHASDLKDHDVTDEGLYLRRREFIRAHHPDRGGDPDVFVSGLRSIDAEQERDSQPLPSVVVVPHRA